jgi:predicted Co/Zn/Cd cation transporter (cation efflux family)
VTGTQPRHLLVGALVAGVLGFVVDRWVESSGGSPLPVPWSALVGMVAIAVGVVVVAWPVRRWNRGDRSRRLDPLRAARAAVLAKAASLSGAILVGWFAGQGLGALGDLTIEPRRDRFVLAMVAVLVATLVLVAGLVGQRWCRRPPDEDEQQRP